MVRDDLTDGWLTLFLPFGVFIKAGSGESSAFTFSSFLCRFPTVTKQSSVPVPLSSVSMFSSPFLLLQKTGLALFSVALVLDKPLQPRLGSLGDVGRITLEISLKPGSKAGVGMGILMSIRVHLPGGFVSSRMKHFRVLPFRSTFTFAWWPGLASFALLMACVMAALRAL